MDNIKYPTFTGTNNEETTRQYDKDKLCTSSVWTFYSNAPIEKKSSLLFHALSSELGTVLSNILTFIETTKTILENSKDNKIANVIRNIENKILYKDWFVGNSIRKHTIPHNVWQGSEKCPLVLNHLDSTDNTIVVVDDSEKDDLN